MVHLAEGAVPRPRAVPAPAHRFALLLEEGTARVGRREVRGPDVIAVRVVGPPVSGTIEAGIERHALAHDARELQRRADLGPRLLVLGGLRRHERAGIAIGLPLAVHLLRQLELVVLRQLVGQLQCRVVETRKVLDLFVGLGGDEAGNHQARVVVTIGRVEPQLVADDRTTQIEADIVVAGELVVAGVEALLPERVGDVVALKRTVLPRQQVGAAELVAARLDDEAERGAWALRLGTLGRARDRDLIVGVVVAEELVPDDAVELDQLATGASIRPRARRRRAADGVAANVKLGGRQAGHQAGQAADTASVGQILQLVLAPVDTNRRGLEVNGRRAAGDRDRLSQRVQLQWTVDSGRRTGVDDHGADRQGAETRQLKLDLVGPRRQLAEAKAAERVGDRLARRADHGRTRNADVDAGENAPARVKCPSRDGAGG